MTVKLYRWLPFPGQHMGARIAAGMIPGIEVVFSATNSLRLRHLLIFLTFPRRHRWIQDRE